MKKKSDNIQKPEGLRQTAEQEFEASWDAATDLLVTNEKKLLHELLINQVELKMQNETLREALNMAEAAGFASELAQNRYIELFEFAPIAYFTLEEDGAVHQVNFRGAQLLGIELSGITGQPFTRYISLKDRPFFMRFLANVFSSDVTHSIELMLQLGDFPCCVAIEAIADKSRQSCLLAVADFSGRNHRKQQDNAHLSELARVTHLGLMNEIASGFAHEVNQPLAAITNYTHISLNMINSANADLLKLAEILYKTQQQALRAGKLIHSMRGLTNNHPNLRPSVDINLLIREAVSLCMADINKSQLNLALKLENNLPTICVDPMQIEQVMINLIRNSIEALQSLPENRGRHLILHTQLTAGQEIQVRIEDNGPGINEDQQQKILMPLYTTKINSIGMGLTISRSLIEAHGGTLRFNSKPGKGCSFYFTLPAE